MQITLPTLLTDRLILRGLRRDDAAAIALKAGVREVADTTLAIPHPYPVGAAVEWIASVERPVAEGHSAVFAVCDGGTEELIGCCGMSISRSHRMAEIGYWLERDRWGQGLMTEAVGEIIRYAFEVRGVEKVHAHHMTRNPASGRVMVKAGMQQEGVRRKHVVKWGVREDVTLYGLLREDWAAAVS